MSVLKSLFGRSSESNIPAKSVPENPIPAALAEAFFLSSCEVLCDDAINEKMTYTQAIYRIAGAMVNDFAAKYPEQAKASPLVRTFFKPISEAFSFITDHAIPHDPQLIATAWLKEHFDPQIRQLITGEGSINAYLEHLSQNKYKLPPLVADYWNPEARQFHRENDGDCNAKGGCPSTNCAAKELVQAARSRGAIK